MARKGRGQDKRGRSDSAPPFCQWPWWMMESPAFHTLSPEGKTALIYLTKRFNGHNNGQIVFGVRSGSRVRNPGQPDIETKDKPIMSPSRMGRALEQIAALKLAVVSKDSSFGQKKLAREWRLSWLPCNGSVPGREFMALSEADCAAILTSIKTKASSASGTGHARTVAQARQAASKSLVKSTTQYQQRDYGSHPQCRQRDTSSNHPISVSDALSDARALMERRALAASMALPSARKFGRPVPNGK